MAETGRLLLPDLGRSLALLGMVVFHLTWDLTMFGFLEPGTPSNGFFWYFARIIAGSFLFLAGLSLWLAHGAGTRWRGFWLRLGKIVAAAAAVSLVTAILMPEVWVFYGILHSIALSSLVGILILRLPIVLQILLAAVVFALPWYVAVPAFDGLLIWTGLSGRIPYTIDFEPFFPWFAPFLAGVIFARLMQRYALWSRVEPRETALIRALAAPGRHSLLIYLLHQPLLLGLVGAVAWLMRG